MSSRLKGLLLLIAIVAAAFLIGRVSAKQPVLEVEKVQVDTLYIRDTITREKPIYTRVYVRDSIYVTDTLHMRDTMWLPREVKVYEDERYRAEVSGYQPSLDRIDIYVSERVITKDVTQVVKVKKPARWGIGVQAGYGIGFIDRKIYSYPYIGVGVSYNFITF